MKLSFWDIMASMVMLAGLALATIFINIFVNPYSFINPFPPPTPIATLDVPTLTPSQRALPELWTTTPTLFGASEAMGTPTITATGSTATGTVTGTVFVLPTNTNTPTPPNTPTITKTLTKTPNKTLTSYYIKTAVYTATKTATKTEEGASGDTIPPTTPGAPYSNSVGSNPNPVFSWGASTDSGGSGLKGYKITWGLDSGGNNPIYTTTATTWTAPTLTANGIYYFYVRAEDVDGNQSSWAGPSRFGFTGAGAPSVTTIVSDLPDPTTVGVSYVVSVTVTGTGTPTGTVSISDGTGATCSITLSSGAGNCTLQSITAGSKTITASYGGDSTNAASSNTAMHTVNKADPVINSWPSASSITYGQTLASSTLSGGDATPAGTFSWITPATAPDAGTAAQNVRFTPTNSANYNTVDGTVNVTVNQAVPTITTPPSATAIDYLDPLSSSTLSGGVASVVGSFAFTTPATVPPNAGTYSASITFTPTDGVNYTTVTGSVNVTVNKLTPTVTDWGSATAITFGDSLADSTLSGVTADVPGTVTFDDDSIEPNAGTYTADVTFTPDDTTNYNTVSGGTVSVTVNKADQTIGAISPTAGSVLAGAATLSPATSSAGLTVVFASTTPAVCTVAGTAVTYNIEGTCSITANQAGDTNYNAAPQVNGTIVVGP